MATHPHPPEADPDDATLADEEWPVAEQYRVEPAPEPPEDEGTLVVHQGGAGGTEDVRRFPPDVGPGLIVVLVGVLLVAILVPAGIWLASRDDDRPATTNTSETTTDGVTTSPTAPATPSGAKTVPDVTGLTLDEARARLEKLGLRVRFRRAPSEQPPGEILRQSPDPNTKLAPNALVVLTVAGAAERIAVPNVEWMQLDEAMATLREADLQAQVRRVQSNRPEGTVVDQIPLAGEQVEADTVVVVEVAQTPTPAPEPPSEPDTVRVPRLIGLTAGDARSRLGELGLRWTQRPVVSSQPRGSVVGQSPQPGAELRERGAVTLRVSTGPARVEIPDVIGLDEQSAMQQLEAAGFEVTVVDEPTTNVDEDGIVLRQRPAGGASRPEGTVVTITVARFS
jgi:beta-lactam-binding protein with PASTA domain